MARSGKATYEDHLRARLRDEQYAAGYLSFAARDNETAFLLALRDVVEAHRVSAVAGKSGLNRESLYRALSPKGNPSLRSLRGILDAIGLEIAITPKRRKSPRVEPLRRGQVKPAPAARAS